MNNTTKNTKKRTYPISIYNPFVLLENIDVAMARMKKFSKSKHKIETKPKEYFHVHTLALIGEDLGTDSEAEDDPVWAQKRRKNRVEDFFDLNSGEKELIIMWNLFITRYRTRYVGKCHVLQACKDFVKEYGSDIFSKRLYNNFILHLTNLGDHKILPAKQVVRVVRSLKKNCFIED